MAINETWIEKDPKVLRGHGKTITSEAMEQNFYNAFIGSTRRAIIQTELQGKTQPGGTTRIFFRKKLDGEGVKGNSDFADNIDEALELWHDVDYELFGNSLKSKNIKIENKLAVDHTRTQFKADLAEWAGTQFSKKIDIAYTRDCTNIVACKSDGVYNVNGTGSIQAGDIFSTRAISAAKKLAKQGRTADGKKVPKIRPFKVTPMSQNGIALTPLQFYVMTIGPNQAEQLKLDPIWLEAQKHADARGALNNIFTGALGIYDGVVIYERGEFDKEDSGIITSKNTDAGRVITNLDDYNGAGGIETELGLFLGAQSGLLAQDDGFDYYEDIVDAGRKFMVGVDRGLGFAKTKFVGKTKEERDSVYHDKDFATILVASALV